MTETTTATEFNREPSKFIRAAEQGVTTVVLKHGQPVAALVPEPRETSGAELGRRLAKMEPQPEAAAAAAEAIRAMNEADRPLHV